jgi:DNA-binding transcriptional LysR family regulator
VRPWPQRGVGCTLDPMELRSLRCAVVLAEELHFGRAAERSYISPQPFGRRIAELERELGMELFARTTRRVRLTAAGERFVTRAERVLIDVDELVADVRASGPPREDRLALGVFGFGLADRAADVMETFRRARPEVAVELRELGFTDMDGAVRDGEVDVGVVHDTGPVARVLLSPLFSVPKAMVVPARSEWADATVLTEREADAIPALALPIASRSQAEWARSPRSTSGLRTPAVITPAVAAMGLACPHGMAAAAFYPHPSVRFVPIDGPTCDMAVAVREDDGRQVVAYFVRIATAIATKTVVDRAA